MTMLIIQRGGHQLLGGTGITGSEKKEEYTNFFHAILFEVLTQNGHIAFQVLGSAV